MSSLSDLPRLPWRQWFPWLELFRAGGLAIGWPQLGISFLAVVALGMGTALLGWWFPRESPAFFATRMIDVIHLDQTSGASTPMLIQAIFPSDMTEHAKPLAPLLLPWRSIAAPLSNLVWNQERMSLRPDLYRQSTFGLAINLAFAVSVWSLFGVAICRAVAVQFAKDRGETLPNALRYASARWPAAMSAPAIPAGGLLAILIGLVIAAWFGRLPFLGGPLLTLATPVLFVAGVAIAVLALTVLLGWPLMIAAIGIDDSDGFGSLSRAYSFVMGRPAYAVWMVLVSLVYGVVLVGLAGGVLTLALLALSKPIAANVGTAEKWGAVLAGSHFCAQLLLATFAASLFWSLATWNYLLLRQAVDQKPLEEIAAGCEETATRDLPVAGIPASDYRPPPVNGQPTVVQAEAIAPTT